MSIVLRIFRCDNRLRFTLNGKVVWEKYYDYNPALNESVDLTPLIKQPPEINVLKVRGYNGFSPGGKSFDQFHFAYRVELDGKPIHDVDRFHDMGSPGAVVYIVEHEIDLAVYTKDTPWFTG